jgi:hypothetical protein
VRYARARDIAARTHAKGHRHTAVGGGVLVERDLVAGAKRAHARRDDATDLFGSEALPRLRATTAGHLALAVAGARALARAEPAFAVTAEPARAGAAGAATEPAAFAGSPAGIEGARAERNAAFRRATAAWPATAEPRARALPEHDRASSSPRRRRRN